MIDLHCHILPGLDDGPATLDEAVRMARIAWQDGIRTLVATPHAFDGRFDVKPSERDRALQGLRDALQQEEIALTLLAGSDCHLSEHLLPSLRDTPAHSLNQAGRAMLVEWPMEIIPAGFDQFLFEARLMGLTPVLTHPERHPEIQECPECLQHCMEQGLRLQATAASLTGFFGREACRTAEILLYKGWVYILATDGHNAVTRRPVLSEALQRAKSIMGFHAIDLVTTNPASLIKKL
ncbi:MAG: CpsB/CapC family capsule biosynthesis tyrosine phosphatase [Planctomycetota bacterium]